MNATHEPGIQVTSPQQTAERRRRLTSLLIQANLSENERAAVLDFATHLLEHYGHLVQEIVLFGSAVRPGERFESDVDIWIVSRQPLHWQLKDELVLLGYRYSLKHGCVLSPILFDRKRAQAHRRWNSLLWRDIQQEGLVLWPLPTGT